MNNHLDFAKAWGDKAAISNMRAHRSQDVMKSEAENHLKDMMSRFERGANGFTTKLWASDIIDAGFTDYQVKEICKSIPLKFEKAPNLSQIMDLLRPYLPQNQVSVSELDKHTKVLYPLILEEYSKVFDANDNIKNVGWYKKASGLNHLPDDQLLQCFIMDWVRAERDSRRIMAIIEKSREAVEKKDSEYFLRTLRSYAIRNNLDVNKLYTEYVNSSIRAS